MYDYNLRRNIADAKYKSIFGLSSLDLTEDQLQKIQFGKLIEFLDSDDRICDIIKNKLLKDSVNDLNEMFLLTDEAISKNKYILDTYNEFIKQRRSDLDSIPGYISNETLGRYVRLKLLNDDNVFNEIQRYIDNKSSVINVVNLDYGALYDKNPYIIRDLVCKLAVSQSLSLVINTINHELIHENDPIISNLLINYMFTANSGPHLEALIGGLPEKLLIETLPRFETFVPNRFCHLLCNKHLPKNYIIKALKLIAGRTHIPRINITIDKEIIEELPPITRLNVLETISYNGKYLNFGTDVTEDVLKHLLFPSTTRYHTRVVRVMDYCKRMIKDKNNEQA